MACVCSCGMQHHAPWLNCLPQFGTSLRHSTRLPHSPTSPLVTHTRSVIGPLLRGSEALTLPGTHTTTASSSSVGVDNIKSLWRGMAAAVSAKAQRAVATMLPSFSSSTLSSAFSSPASSVSGGSLPREQQLSDRDLICARW